MFTQQQLDLLLEVAEVYRIPSVVKYAMKLHLVEGRTKEEAVHRAGVGCMEGYEDWLSGLRETYLMAAKHTYPKRLSKRTLTEVQFNEMSEHVHLTKRTSDKIKLVLVDGKVSNLYSDQDTKMGLEMLQELADDINKFRNSISTDLKHQQYMVA